MADWMANRSATGAGQTMTRQRGLYQSPAYQAPWWTQRGGGFGYHNQPSPAPAVSQPSSGSVGGSMASVSSTPRRDYVFTGDQTGSQVASAMATAHQQADPDWQMKQFIRPGMSRSAGTLAKALPSITQARTAATAAAYGLPLLDHAQNLQMALDAQYQQGQEALSLFNLARRLQRTNDYQQTSLMSPLLSLALGFA